MYVRFRFVYVMRSRKLFASFSPPLCLSVPPERTPCHTFYWFPRLGFEETLYGLSHQLLSFQRMISGVSMSQMCRRIQVERNARPKANAPLPLSPTRSQTLWDATALRCVERNENNLWSGSRSPVPQPTTKSSSYISIRMCCEFVLVHSVNG